MTTSKLSALLGVDDTPVQWERPLLLFMALFVLDVRWLIVSPVSGFMVSEGLSWFEVLITSLVTAYMAMLSFRLVRSFLGLVPFAVLAALAAWPITLLLLSLRHQGDVPVDFLISPLIWALLFFGCLELALRLFRSPFIGLLVGSLLGRIMYFLVMALVLTLTREEGYSFTRHLQNLPYGLIDAIIFALVLAGALRFATGRSDFLNRAAPANIPRAFFTGAFLALNVVTFLCVGALLYWRIDEPYWVHDHDGIMQLGIFFLGMFVIAIMQGVVFCRFVYRMWAALRNRGARMNSSWAVGGLFIPLFNLFWMFQVFPGFATDYNRFSERSGLAARMGSGWLIAYPCIILIALPAMFLLQVLPYPAWAIVVLPAIMHVVLASKVCNAINALPPAGGAAVVAAGGSGVTETVEGNPLQEG